MEIKSLIIIFYLLVNLLGFLIMKIDKNRAIHHEFRISEKTLWITALFGGAAGTTIGMHLFHHKTKHLAFKLGFPLLAVLELILFCKTVFLSH